MRNRWLERPCLCVGLIALLSFAVYVNSLGGEFIWDDVAQVRENPFIMDLGNLWHFFFVNLGEYTAFPGFSPYYRPLFLVSYALDYSVWGLNPLGYHLTNAFLHSLCSLLVYVIAARLLEDANAAFTAGAIFAVHPIHAEAVAWIAGRADLLAALFTFASFYLYVTFRESGNRLRLAFSLLSCVLSLLSKEAAISLPFLVAAHEFLCVRKQQNVEPAILWPVLFMLLAALYFVLRTLVMGAMVLGHPDAPPIGIGRVYPTIQALVEYLRLFFLPVGLKVLYYVPIRASLSIPEIVLSVSVVCLLSTALFIAYRTDRKLFFGLLWFLIGIAPVLGAAGLVLMADRYLYIPSLGLCLASGVSLSRLSELTGAAKYCARFAVALLVLFSITTVRRNAIWKNELIYFEQAIEDAPDFAMSRNNLGKWYLDHKMPQPAVTFFKKAVELDPSYSFALVNLGNAYLQINQHEEAIAAFRKSISTSPRFADAYYGLGNAYREMARMDEAVKQWEIALALNPAHSEANNNLGNIHLLRGDYRKAAIRYAAALKGRPLNLEAHYNLAIALEKQGDLKGAMAHYQKFVILAPEEYKSTVAEVKRKLASFSKVRN